MMARPSHRTIQQPWLAAQKRILQPHNFTKALKEITPSASESPGTPPDLRKWNDEFGEGRKRKKQA